MAVHWGGRGPGHMSRLTKISGGDPFESSVVLLSGFEGTDGSTTLVDESLSARTLTAQSTAQIDTAQFKFGASSLLLNGTSDYVTAPDSTDFDFGSGQFTIEGFFRFTANNNVIGLVNHYDGTNGWGIFVNGGQLEFNANGGTYLARYADWFTVRATNQWYHIAVDRDGAGKVRLYLDGVMVASNAASTAILSSTNALAIGRLGHVALWYMPGHIDELRITKGTGRYASDSGFTVPTAAYPRG